MTQLAVRRASANRLYRSLPTHLLLALALCAPIAARADDDSDSDPGPDPFHQKRTAAMGPAFWLDAQVGRNAPGGFFVGPEIAGHGVVAGPFSMDIFGGLYYVSGGAGPVTYDSEFAVGTPFWIDGIRLVVEPQIGMGLDGISIVNGFVRFGLNLYKPIGSSDFVLNTEYLKTVNGTADGLRLKLFWVPGAGSLAPGAVTASDRHGLFYGIRSEIWFGNDSGVSLAALVGWQFD